MDIKRAKEEIKDTIAAYLQKDVFGEYVIPSIRQRPMLLIGPPGIGKTQIMEQISQECRIGLVAYTITHHTRQSAIGLPFIERKSYGGREYAVTEYTMSEIVAAVYDKIEQTGLEEGILFIDEINCVSETLAPTMLQFLQGKSFGSHKIPEGWVIVAAGNPPEYNKSVREFDIVTLDRIRMLQVEPNLEVWLEYARKVNIHPAICSYLQVRRQNFCRIETTVDGKMFATPRGWEDLSELLGVYESLDKPVDRELMAEYIQFPGIAKDFANYLELYDKYREDYQVERILAGDIPAGAAKKLERAAFDERIGVIRLLLGGLNNQFCKVSGQEALMKILQDQLKKLKAQELFAERPMAAYGQMMTALVSQREKKQADGLLSRGEKRLLLKLEAEMERYRGVLYQQFSSASESEDVWSAIQGLFGEDSDAFEASVNLGGQMLEHAFDFMETVFADSQEMVLFLTELNRGFYSVQFLQLYECERYYRYNQNLLFEEQERMVLESFGE